MRTVTGRLTTIAGIPLVVLALLWMVEAINLLVGGALDQYGIRPRDTNDLAGIVWAPFIHVSVAHLLANSLPLLILSAIVLLRGVRTFVFVTLIVMLVGGLGAWLVGRPFSVIVGASGVIFGYLGYLLARGVVDRSLGAVLVSLAVLVVYGGALWGLLPSQPGISFEGHITGFVSGALAAWILSTRRVPVSRTKRDGHASDRPALLR